MNKQKGITLVEACVTLAVATIVATSAAPSMQQLLDARRFDGIASQLASDLQLTRVSAVARNQRLRFSLQAGAAGSCYVIHTGSADACRCGASGPTMCSPGANEIRTVRLPAADRVQVQANVASILFDPVHGTSTPTGTVRVIGANGRELRHVVNVMGRVRTCSPQGSVGGYRAC
jgi:type IV fimbrial biogenesis protein FimT